MEVVSEAGFSEMLCQLAPVVPERESSREGASETRSLSGSRLVALEVASSVSLVSLRRLTPSL